MIGKVTVTSTSYDQFKRRLRKLVPRCPDEMVYAEWNKCLRREGSIDYDRHAKNIQRKITKARTGA